VLGREQVLPVEISRAFDFFADPHNLEAITPPLLRFRIVSAPERLGVGSLIEYRLRLHGVPIRWLTRIEVWEPPVRFVDLQLRGPFSLWEHSHSFAARGAETMMWDEVRYRLPFGPLGDIVRRLIVERDVEEIFDFRREALRELLGSAD